MDIFSLIKVKILASYWAIGFKTAGITLATAGLLSPWLAALFHHISSVLVVLNSARLIRGNNTGGDRKADRIQTIPPGQPTPSMLSASV